jgi:hypothetical protein
MAPAIKKGAGAAAEFFCAKFQVTINMFSGNARLPQNSFSEVSGPR